MEMAANLTVAGDEESPHLGRKVVEDYTSRSQKELGKNQDEGSAPTTFGDLFCERLGTEDFFSLEVWQASMAELVGTAVLVFTIDAIIISFFESHVDSPNLLIAIFISVCVTVLLLATFPISGGHLNPVITLSAALLGLISLARATIYILAQCVGAVLGALMLKAILSDTIERTFSLGGCTLTVVAPDRHGRATTIGIDTGPALWMEVVCTFVLLFASVRVAFDEQHARALGPVVVCGIIGADVGLMSFISTTVTTTKKGYAGAGMNPARCVGPAIVRGGHLWHAHWVFWVGPFIACVAFYVYTKVIPKQHFHPRSHGYKYDFLTALKTLRRSGGGKKQEL